MDTPEKVTSYFRYEEVLIGDGYTDVSGEYVSTGSHVRLQLREFQVLKHTPKGVRIDDYETRATATGSVRGRFISRDWNKQWASPTVEGARLSFIARKKRQARILEAQLRQAQEAMRLAEEGFKSSGDLHLRVRELLPTEVGWLVPRPAWARGSG